MDESVRENKIWASHVHGVGRFDAGGRRRAPNGRVVWSLEEVRELGMVTDIPTAAEILGVGRTLAFALFRAGEFPVPVLRIGHRAVVPVAGLLNLLHADTYPELPPLSQPQHVAGQGWSRAS